MILLTFDPQLFRGLVRCEADPQDRPHHLAEGDDLLHTAIHNIYRDGKAHTAVGS